MGFLHKSVGIVVLQRLVSHGNLVAGRDDQFAQQRGLRAPASQRRKVAGTGLIAAGQAGGPDVVGCRSFPATWPWHSSGPQNPCHRDRYDPRRMGRRGSRDISAKCGISPRVRVVPTVRRAAAPFGIHIILGDREQAHHGQLGLGDQHFRRGLGQRRYRQQPPDRSCAAMSSVTTNATLDGDQRVIDFMQTRHRPKKVAGTYALWWCFGCAGGDTGGLDAGGRLALCDGTVWRWRHWTCCFLVPCFDICRACGRRDEGKALRARNPPLEKSIHCSVAAMVHQSAPNGKLLGAVYRSKKSRKINTLRDFPRKVSEL